jgi:glycosyltransferase involved in cell wall biosynthesis
LAFALTMLPRLRRGDFDVLHVIDPPLAAVLSRMKRLGLFGSTLLFTEGSNMPPELYPKVDHVHHVAQAAYENGVRYGHPASHLTLVPCGLHAEKFPFSDDRAALRRKHSVRDETFVVLAVSAVKRNHKRVDHIIGEVSKLAGDVLLWIDGNPEDADVVRLADEKLGSRCRITHVPTAQIAELYRLADVKVSASLAESFGLALVEAMSSGTSVLAHDSSHFRWLLDDERCVVDMTATGALSARLAALRHEPIDRAAAKQRSDSIRRRFDWNVVKPAYVEMYRRVAQLDVATERAEAASVEAPVVTV